MADQGLPLGMEGQGGGAQRLQLLGDEVQEHIGPAWAAQLSPRRCTAG
jgi:hypothetical protein